MNPDPNQPQPQPQAEPQVPTPAPVPLTPQPYVPGEQTAVQPAQTYGPVPVAPVPSPAPVDEVPAQDPYAAQPAPAPIAQPMTQSAPFDPAPGMPIQDPNQVPQPQPGVAPAPYPGAQPASMFNAAPAAPPLPPAGKKSPLAFLNGPKRTLFIIIGAVVGALIILGIAALIVFGLIFPSRADYRAAVTQFDNVSAAYSKLNGDASALQFDYSSTTTDTKFTNDIGSFDGDLKSFQDENAKLGNLKAVKIGDGKKQYDTYKAKVDGAVTYIQNISTSIKTLRPALKICSDTGSGTSATTALNQCVDALNKTDANGIPDADLKNFFATFKTQYTALVSVIAQISAIKDPYGTQYNQYTALRNQTYDISDKLSAASSDLSSNLDKHSNDIDPASTANAFSDFLVKKANG